MVYLYADEHARVDDVGWAARLFVLLDEPADKLVQLRSQIFRGVWGGIAPADDTTPTFALLDITTVSAAPELAAAVDTAIAVGVQRLQSLRLRVVRLVQVSVQLAHIDERDWRIRSTLGLRPAVPAGSSRRPTPAREVRCSLIVDLPMNDAGRVLALLQSQAKAGESYTASESDSGRSLTRIVERPVSDVSATIAREVTSMVEHLRVLGVPLIRLAEVSGRFTR